MKVGDLLKADRAYVVTVKEAGDYEFVAHDVTVSAEPETPIAFKHLETSNYKYDFYGTYVGIGASHEHEWMAMGGGKIRWNKTSAATLAPYRWYIRPDEKIPDDAKPNIFIVEGDDDTDGINNAQTAESEIQGIYTLGGIKVEHPVKGVNIIKYTDGRTKKINVK